MRWILLALMVFMAGGVRAVEISSETLGVVLIAPEGWTEKERMLRPPGVEKEQAAEGVSSHESRAYRSERMRKLHLVEVKTEAKSLEDAIFQEIERIEQRRENGRSGTNGSSGYAGAIPFRTDSGIDGLCALFVSEDQDSHVSSYSINKYYFRHKNGSIYKICAHVYGGHEQADQFDEAVRKGLRYMDRAD